MPVESANNAILVLTNLPESASAERLAEILISSQRAACVNILAPCTSVYQWQGKLEKVSDLPMMIKSTRNLYQDLEDTLLNIIPTNSLKTFVSVLILASLNI